MIQALPLKLIAAPAIAAIVFLANLVSDLGGSVGVILNLAALGTLVSGFVIVGYYRSSLDAKNEIIKDLKEERDIDRDKAERLGGEVRDLLVTQQRLEGEIQKAEERIRQLESHPDLSVLLTEIQSGRESAVAIVGARLDALGNQIDALTHFVKASFQPAGASASDA